MSNRKTIFITGAGAGIGAALAKTSAVYGASVVLVGRTRSKLDAVYDWIGEQTGREAAIVPADLSALTDASADALRDAIDGSFGRCDALCYILIADVEHMGLAALIKVIELVVGHLSHPV